MLQSGAETARQFAYIMILFGGLALQSRAAEYFVAIDGSGLFQMAKAKAVAAGTHREQLSRRRFHSRPPRQSRFSPAAELGADRCG